MRAPEPTPEEGIGTLFARVIDDSRDLVRAELNLYKEVTLNRLLRSRTAIALAVGAVLLAQASVTALLVGLVLGLAQWIGPIGSGAVVAGAGLLICALLLRAAQKRRASKPESGTGS